MNIDRKSWFAKTLIAATVFLSLGVPEIAQAERLLGLDVSYWQTEISAANWATLKRATNEQVNGVNGDGRDFVFVRASRGGTTGIDRRGGGFGASTYELSQRYDDPYFVQNMTRATAAGLFAGPYHYSRPDVVASTPNSGGIANDGTDEANHFLEMASAWMRPGYLLPVFDLEEGNPERTRNELAQFCRDFSDRIHAVTGVRPIMYINGSYCSYLETATSPSPAALVSAYPRLWVARYTLNDDPASTAHFTGHPKDSAATFYGPWDNSPNPAHPWSIWQYGSTAARLNGYKNGTAAIDVNVLQGGMEFLKDHLVPALWQSDSSGSWTTQTNWNSGKAPAAPTPGPGQLTPIGTLTLPTTRLPGSNDIVILGRSNANITVTLSSGTQNIRKLFVQETLNITGGSLTVNYVPSADSTPLSAQFSAPVTLTNTGTFSVHTLQVDASNTFTLAGGTFTADTVRLMPHASLPSKLLVKGNLTYHGLGGTATITNGTGSGSAGQIDLDGGTRTFTVQTTNDIFLSAVISNGGLLKNGTGKLRLNRANTFAGGTTVNGGTLLVNNTTGSGTGSGTVTVAGGTLSGTGTIQGTMTVNSLGTVSPGTATSIGTLTLNAAPVFGGTNFMEINRNGGTPLADKITLTSGTMTYGGTLGVTNAGAALVGGEVFTLFSAPSYLGSFSSVQLPPLSNGLSWYLGNLLINGTIKVNRNPITTLLTYTNTSLLKVQIPITNLTSNVTDADGDAITLTSINSSTNGVAVTTNGSFLEYASAVNALDQFTYTVTDGRGGNATGTVRILPFQGGIFRRPPTSGINSVTLHLLGGPGSTNFLERSTNLVGWETISTNVLPSSGVFDFVDQFPTPSGPGSSAFYRLRW